MNIQSIIDTLEEIYPNRLPDSLSDYSERKILMDMGRQEVIRTLKRLIDNERNSNSG